MAKQTTKPVEEAKVEEIVEDAKVQEDAGAKEKPAVPVIVEVISKTTLIYDGNVYLAGESLKVLDTVADNLMDKDFVKLPE